MATADSSEPLAETGLTLEQVLQFLQAIDQPNLIVEAHRHFVQGEQFTEHDCQMMKKAVAGGYAAYKLIFYLDELRSINELRLALGKQVAPLLAYLNQIPTESWQARSEIEFQINSLSAQQEITYHRFANTAIRIKDLLTRACDQSWTRIDSTDDAYLQSYRALRNHFEHLESQITSPNPEVGIATIICEPDLFKVTIGFPLDDQGRFITPDGLAEVNSEAVDRIVDIVGRYWKLIEENILTRMEKYFTSSPNQIPSLEDLVNRPQLFTQTVPGSASRSPTDDGAK